MNDLVAFDIEAWSLDEGRENERDWNDVSWREQDLGISCVSIVTEDNSSVYYPGSQSGLAPYGVDRPMDEDEADSILQTLYTYSKFGYRVVSWNGSGYDFFTLGKAANNLELAAKLMWNHYDVMFQILCTLGYPVGLGKVGEGMHIGAKTEGMRGDLAVFMWHGDLEGFKKRERAGEYLAKLGGDDIVSDLTKSRAKVLEYVEQDARLTLELINGIIEKKHIIKWVSGSGKLKTLDLGDLLKCKDCLTIPVPDVSWMTNPMRRESLVGWAKEFVD